MPLPLPLSLARPPLPGDVWWWCGDAEARKKDKAAAGGGGGSASGKGMPKGDCGVSVTALKRPPPVLPPSAVPKPKVCCLCVGAVCCLLAALDLASLDLAFCVLVLRRLLCFLCGSIGVRLYWSSFCVLLGESREQTAPANTSLGHFDPSLGHFPKPAPLEYKPPPALGMLV